MKKVKNSSRLLFLTTVFLFKPNFHFCSFWLDQNITLNLTFDFTHTQHLKQKMLAAEHNNKPLEEDSKAQGHLCLTGLLVIRLTPRKRALLNNRSMFLQDGHRPYNSTSSI